jgi:hypothetical protein
VQTVNVVLWLALAFQPAGNRAQTPPRSNAARARRADFAIPKPFFPEEEDTSPCADRRGHRRRAAWQRRSGVRSTHLGRLSCGVSAPGRSMAAQSGRRAVERMIDEGVRIGAGAGPEVADQGRPYSKGRMPW